MNIVTIDTATELLGVSVTTETGSYYEHIVCSGLHHMERLMPVVASLMNEAGLAPNDIGLIVCAQGPGSFTGLRIGMAAAKGLGHATGAPIVSVPTLDAMAYPFRWFAGIVVPVLDARKDRIYCALYHSGSRNGDYLDLSTGDLVSRIGDRAHCLIVGFRNSGVDSISGRLSNASVIVTRSLGTVYAELGAALLRERGADRTDAGPMYLRPSDAELHQRNGKGT